MIIDFRLFSDVIRKDGKNADAIYVRGMVLYYEDNIDKAFQHFQHVLRLAPDHVKAKLTYKVRYLKFYFSSKSRFTNTFYSIPPKQLGFRY